MLQQTAAAFRIGDSGTALGPFRKTCSGPQRRRGELENGTANKEPPRVRDGS